MAIKVTQLHTNTQAQGARVCLRNSSGVPYLVVESIFGPDGVEVWKGGVAGSVYHFDGSDVAATDPDAVWTDETNSDDGSTGTKATSTTSGTETTNEIYIEGTNAPSSGGDIIGVRVRMHGGTNASQSWGTWVTLYTPSGGWTWAKIQALEVTVHGSGIGLYGQVYTNAKAETLLEQAWLQNDAATDDYAVTRVEIQVFEESTTPTSFVEQDAGNNPEGSSYGSCSAAIDSTDIIHIAYMYDNGKTSELRYVTFDADGTTDTFAGDAQVIADIGDDPVSIAKLSTAITIDSSDIPHVAYTEFGTDMGTSWSTIKYNNRVGGAWNASSTEILMLVYPLDIVALQLIVMAINGLRGIQQLPM
jgi:hypothetical protein